MSANATTISSAERYGNLKEVLFVYVDQLAAIRQTHPQIADQTLLFLYLCYPWVVDATQITPEQARVFEARKQEVAAVGFDGEKAKAHLQEILTADKHLRECCSSDASKLAHYLDMAFINSATLMKKNHAAVEQQESRYREFEASTFEQGPFKRMAVSHLFNFEIDGDAVVFEGSSPEANIRVQRVSDSTIIPQILGETGFQAFLHPAGIGNCFAIDEEGASSEGDFDWLWNKRLKASLFSEVLQYFKDGVVHLGYSAPVFLPNWVNQIRRIGLYFVGNARRIAYENGSKLYRLGAKDLEQVKRWWKVITTPEVFQALASKRGKLREAIYRAGNYFEASHQREGNIERLLALAIAIESLFSPPGGSEIKFRIAQSTAQFLGSTPVERQEIFEQVQTMYKKRSRLVHGSYDLEEYENNTFVTTEQIELWTGHLRRALVGFIAVYLKKEALTRDDILARIEQASFSEEIGNKLRSDADIEPLIEWVLTKGYIHKPETALGATALPFSQLFDSV